MEHLDFIIWLISYPIESATADLISAKKRKIEGKEPHSDGVIAFSALVSIIIWASVANALF